MKQMRNFRGIYFFENLTEKQIKRLEQISVSKKYKKDNILFFQGDNAIGLHILTEGVLKVYKTDLKGNEIIMNYFYPVNLIAELASLDHINYPATALFETDGSVITIDYKIFEEEFLRNPDISFSIIKSLTKKLRYLDLVISQNLTMDSTGRVAKFIYENEPLFLQLKQNKIASILNITPETMSRVIRKLKDCNIIEIKGRKITVSNREELRDYWE